MITYHGKRNIQFFFSVTQENKTDFSSDVTCLLHFQPYVWQMSLQHLCMKQRKQNVMTDEIKFKRSSFKVFLTLHLDKCIYRIHHTSTLSPSVYLILSKPVSCLYIGKVMFVSHRFSLVSNTNEIFKIMHVILLVHVTHSICNFR